MRIMQLRQADLNLLAVFTVLAEERNVSCAAGLFLGQPAVSRALQRLRDMFHDDLLVRTAAGFEPTLNHNSTWLSDEDYVGVKCIYLQLQER